MEYFFNSDKKENDITLKMAETFNFVPHHGSKHDYMKCAVCGKKFYAHYYSTPINERMITHHGKHATQKY